jgi:hypothetical protein
MILSVAAAAAGTASLVALNANVPDLCRCVKIGRLLPADDLNGQFAGPLVYVLGAEYNTKMLLFSCGLCLRETVLLLTTEEFAPRVI